MADSGRPSRRDRQRMAGAIAKVIRVAFTEGWISSLFGLEGALRAAVRQDLCLNGWRWSEANETAVEVVHSAHVMLGAQRPSWYEGQLEWTISEGLLIERTRCVNCHKRLPEWHHKYCGNLCSNAHRLRAAYHRKGHETVAVRLAIKSI